MKTKDKKPEKKPEKKPDQKFVFPPADFSNAMIELMGDEFDFRGWQDSKEWKLYNAGRKAAFRSMEAIVHMQADECQFLQQAGGFPRRD